MRLDDPREIGDGPAGDGGHSAHKQKIFRRLDYFAGRLNHIAAARRPDEVASHADRDSRVASPMRFANREDREIRKAHQTAAVNAASTVQMFGLNPERAADQAVSRACIEWPSHLLERFGLPHAPAGPFSVLDDYSVGDSLGHSGSLFQRSYRNLVLAGCKSSGRRGASIAAVNSMHRLPRLATASLL